MSIMLYFGKVNLISEHVYKVYSGEIQMREILSNLLINFKDGLQYQEENSYIGDDGEQHTNVIEYSVYVKEKTDTFIRGRLDKKFRLLYKEKNPITRELETKGITNTDAIEFYFDIFNEMVGYNTSIRFGHKKFLEIFGIMINLSMDKAELDYRFIVDRYTNGIDIKELYRELKEIKAIQKLSFTFRPINPDKQTLKSIQDNGKDRLEQFENANLSTKSILLTSASKLGLNIDSYIVREQLDEADNLQRDVDARNATSKGYVKVEATGRDGVTKSTEDKAPIKRKIHRMSEFVKACEDVIRQINARSFDNEE
ncbi:hypothetical protein [Dorea sp. D27]|uniref:hypothetical protein n=1 Tax=Dorea sp. D27 TaxID=658665 RepID=UPI000673B8C3|nr:hypothetical protein [Dorea sp. D27]KMZ52351.1 hypothetical protein HMPREF0980_03554 [Dorea sp. D27]